MATYTELYQLSSDPILIGKVAIAIAVSAEAIRTEDPGTPNHTQRISWAISSLSNPDQRARQIMWLLLAQNSSLGAAQIQGASDAAIQTACNNAIDLMSAL